MDVNLQHGYGRGKKIMYTCTSKVHKIPDFRVIAKVRDYTDNYGSKESREPYSSSWCGAHSSFPLFPFACSCSCFCSCFYSCYISLFFVLSCPFCPFYSFVRVLSALFVVVLVLAVDLVLVHVLDLVLIIVLVLILVLDHVHVIFLVLAVVLVLILVLVLVLLMLEEPGGVRLN